ncbi:MAG: ion transporter [Hyphomicrobiaceae bacterium]
MRLETANGVARRWEQVKQSARELADWLRPIITSETFERIVFLLIVFNAVTLGLETVTSVMDSVGGLIHLLDTLILTFFVLEISSRMLVHGRAFWRDPWSLFDFIVVAVSFMPGADNISVLRALRTLRALRLVSIVPSMRRVVNSLLIAIPGMASIVFLMLLIFYVFSVMATNMFGADFPDRFGSIGISAFTLFQVMTLDGWSGEVVRPVMEKHPWAWVFFIPFVLITAFTVLNLFIGIIVDAMQQQHMEDRAEAERKLAQKLGKLDEAFSARIEDQEKTDQSQDDRMDRLFSELKSLRSELKARNGTGTGVSGEGI